LNNFYNDRFNLVSSPDFGSAPIVPPDFPMQRFLDLAARAAAWMMFRKSRMKDSSGNKWVRVNSENRISVSILRRWSALDKYHKEQTSEENAHVLLPKAETSPKPDSLSSGDRTRQYSVPASQPSSEKCI
jgi:hypothetical protein